MASAPAFCRVALTSKPTADSDIKIEVWLPASGWNGKLQAVGNGGWAGTISYQPLAAAVALGYAAASTDSGHTTPGASFAVGHPEKLVDYAHRSLHELAIHAKAVVGAYYGKQPAASLWNGCSTGGNQGLTLASMYPADFDAIIAGAPPDERSRVHAVRLVLHRIVHRSAGSYIPPEKYPAIHQAALDACDLKDGVKDGVIENPPSCRFDPKVMQCSGADGPSCLTAEQVETARALVRGRQAPEVRPGALHAAAAARFRTAVGNPRGTTAVFERVRDIQVPCRKGRADGIRRDSTQRPTSRKWTQRLPCSIRPATT